MEEEGAKTKKVACRDGKKTGVRGKKGDRGKNMVQLSSEEGKGDISRSKVGG